MPRAGKLTHAEQLFVVQQLGRYKKPTEIAAEVKERFGKEITRQAVHSYDPEHNPGLLKKWRDAFDKAREGYRSSVDSIGIAQQPFRLEALDEIYRKAKSPVVQMQALEQAAKERGGAFTNRHEVFDARTWDPSTATPEQLQKIAAGEDPRRVLAGK
jgi:hypothetical protein